MTYKKPKGDVIYYKPLSCFKGKKKVDIVGYQNMFGQWCDLHVKSKPIAYSTKATQGWLQILKDESSSWEEMLNKANGTTGEYIPDYEAVSIIEAYIQTGAPFEEVRF